jgi:hypothetical protein
MLSQYLLTYLAKKYILAGLPSRYVTAVDALCFLNLLVFLEMIRESLMASKVNIGDMCAPKRRVAIYMHSENHAYTSAISKFTSL